jgi:hypothetical protein
VLMTENPANCSICVMQQYCRGWLIARKNISLLAILSGKRRLRLYWLFIDKRSVGGFASVVTWQVRTVIPAR